MAARANKVMVVGVDSPIAPRLFQWAMEGKLPALRKMIEEGVYARNCLVPLPTITPPNWTTIATGAWPGTHGVTDFHAHVPGDPLHKVHKAFESSESLAEPLWDAVARDGKSAIVVNWPTSWGSGPKNGFQISGFGLAPTDWQIGGPKGRSFGMLAVDALISTGYYIYGTQIEFRKASGWSGVEHTTRALEATARVDFRRTRHAMDPVSWHILVDSSSGSGYDTVVVAKSKTESGVYARLHAGQWSENVQETFATEIGPQKAVFRLKLLELSPDAQDFRLYVVGPCALHGWGIPASIEDEITSESGMPISKAAWEGYVLDWVDIDTVIESYELENNWLVDAITYLLKNKPWDAFFTHLHAIDWLYHYLTLKLDPLTAEKPEEAPYWQDVELRIYQSVDRAVGRILSLASEDTAVVVVSDHGAKTQTIPFEVNDVLEKAGLLVYLPDEAVRGQLVEEDKTVGALPIAQQKTIQSYLGLSRVDWSRTKAVGQRSVHVYVNLRGRDPGGVVQPGEEYERVVGQIIDALYTYVDPESGKRPVALALRREDARIIGHYSERSGDVIYALSPEFGQEHGQHLTTSRYGIGDLHGLFMMKGPGVKRNTILDRSVWLTDVVPTLCYLAELPVPKDCEGAVIYQALENPDAMKQEVQSLRQTVERLTKRHFEG